MSLVILSAKSGSSENATMAPAVDATDVTMEDARAYLRRDCRRRKKVFQSSAVEEFCGAAEEVDALRVRHSEGVKKDDGVLVGVEGRLIATDESLEVISR